jgi:hypothetical protein
MEPAEPRMPGLLAALEGYPIREGESVLLELTSSPAATEAVRSWAIRVLTWVADVGRLRQLTAGIGSANGMVVEALLTLAYRRSVPIPQAWLEHQIASAKDERELFPLLKIYVLAASRPGAYGYVRPAEFLHELLLKALQPTETSLVTAFCAALNATSEHRDRPFLGENSIRLASDVLTRFAAIPAAVPLKHVSLAVEIVADSEGDDVRAYLGAALKAGIELVGKTSDGSNREKVEALATAMAIKLAQKHPGDLLKLPGDSAPIASALQAVSAARGWLVFAGLVTDAEGQPVAGSDEGGDLGGDSAPGDGRFDGEQIRRLRVELMKRYPSREELAILVSDSLGLNLNEVAALDNLTTATHQLIEWANADPARRLKPLVLYAARERQNSTELQSLSQYLSDGSGAQPTAT